MSRKQTVLIIQRRLTAYRIPFFLALRDQLDELGIELRLAVGVGTAHELARNDGGELDWALPLRTRYLLGGRICWQPFWTLLSDVDMVVVTHENKLIFNLLVQFLPHAVKVGLWGHGANFQARNNRLRECFKRLTAMRADWWFGYTEISRRLICGQGFPLPRFSVVNNSIDIAEIQADAKTISQHELSEMRRNLDLVPGKVGIYIGSLYPEKCIEFLIEAGRKIHQLDMEFRLVVMGAGQDSSLVQRAAETEMWLKYVGPQRGRKKAAYLRLADVYMHPGALGLGILDAFALGLPVATTACGMHGPEIAYLEPGENGILTAFDVDEYARQCLRLVDDGSVRACLAAGSRRSAQKYSVAAMAQNFAEGIQRCLSVLK